MNADISCPQNEALVNIDDAGNVRHLEIPLHSIRQATPQALDENEIAEGLFSDLLEQHVFCSSDVPVQLITRFSHSASNSLVYFFDVHVDGVRYLDLDPTLAIVGETVLLNFQLPDELRQASRESGEQQGFADLLSRIQKDFPAVQANPDCAGGCVLPNGMIEPGFHSSRPGINAWRVSNSRGEIAVYFKGSPTKHFYEDGVESVNDQTDYCEVRYPRWPKNTSGKATSLNPYNTLTETTTSTRCTADDFFGTCHWRMKYFPNVDHRIHEVLDGDGGEQTDIMACSSTATPSFTSSSFDPLQEQAGFFAMFNGRFFANQNGWNNYTPLAESDVRLVVDDPDVPTARYTAWDQRIRCNGDGGSGDGSGTACEAHFIFHEYGHYVNWTYGGFSGVQCEPGVGEGDALHETIANAWGMVFMMDSADIAPQYGASSAQAGFNYPRAHIGGNGFQANVICPLNEQGVSSEAFLQGLWELLFNRNCEDYFCNSASLFNLYETTNVWHHTSEEAVIAHIAEALAFAIVVTPYNGTHAQFSLNFKNKIGADSGTATRNRAAAVLAHHAY